MLDRGEAHTEAMVRLHWGKRAITPETDATVDYCRGLAVMCHEADLPRLYELRAEAANGYMLYAHKPLSDGADRSPWADGIRAARQAAYRDLWLALDDEAGRR